MTSTFLSGDTMLYNKAHESIMWLVGRIDLLVWL